MNNKDSDGRNVFTHHIPATRSTKTGWENYGRKCWTLDQCKDVRTYGAVSASFMAESHILCVGIGGATGICEDLARTHLGKLTCVDYDVVDESNLQTQGYDVCDIGLPKVEALGRRLAEINPEIRYTGIQKDFTTYSDFEIDELLSDVDLLLMMTDSFECQAFGNIVSLRTLTPAIFAAVYAKARAGEVTFNHPHLTPACHRCATWSRYEEYEEGFENDVTSRGSTIFATHFINAIIGHIALALLHTNSDFYYCYEYLDGKKPLEFRWWTEYLQFNQNLIQFQMNPHFGDGEETIFSREYGSSLFNFNFNTVWQKITPVSSEIYGVSCPDCGGFGDLRKSRDYLLNRLIDDEQE